MAIKALPNIETALPERSGRMTVRYGNVDYQTSVQGTGIFHPPATRKVAEGQFFHGDDTKAYAPVVVLGRTVGRTLFPTAESRRQICLAQERAVSRYRRHD